MLEKTAFALVSLLCLVGAPGCAGTGQPEISYDAYAVSGSNLPVEAGDWTVTLDSATVAFGPVYFCAAASGSATLCETAIAELTTITAFDALAEEPARLGTVHGFTGAIRSASYDYGIHWFLTEDVPTPAPATPGGHSAHFEGRAQKDTVTLRFVADVDVTAQFQGQRSVQSTPASARIEGGVERLDVHFDAAAWLAGVDFDEALASGEDPYVIKPGTPSYDAIVISMTAQRPPSFEWKKAP